MRNWCAAHIEGAPVWLIMNVHSQEQWVSGCTVVGWSCCPWRMLLPFSIHAWQLSWGNSQYWMFGDLVTVVNCKILQIRAHLAAQGWQIIRIGCGCICSVHTAAGGWREGEDSPLRSAASMVGYRKPNSISYRDANINISFEGVQIDYNWLKIKHSWVGKSAHAPNSMHVGM